jgi:rare lipoprotein A
MAGGGQQDAPVLAIHSAPPGMVKAEVLAPPPGAGQSGGVRQAAALPVPAARAAAGPAAVAEVPLRLPERVWLTSPRPGSLVIEAGAFSAPAYANLLRERLTAFGARVATDYNAPRDRAFMVRIGPLPTVQAADATLQRVLALVPDARIMVE